MKYFQITFLLISVSSLFSGGASAQFLGGFFSQQSDKKKLMAEQIAGYQLYLNGIKTAYTIADKGLTTANQLKNGTFSLHSNYLTSLQLVAPAISDDPKGKAISDYYQQIISLFQTELNWQRKQKLLSAPEIAYLQKIGDNLRAKAKPDMDELKQVLTPGQLQLTDAERLERLDHLYEAMKDKAAFAGYFTAKCRKLALSRKDLQREKEQIRKLYGIQ
ncbi:hypothetical protein [Mucilaginibacter sp. UYCu711]|uniref:hypothetical protein n=1 Tax=Mucilaginibacter sp. UYCu711 TaxID=3156339 RepID=UPI003D22104A